MKASARLRPRGFWRGLVTGLVLAAAAVVGLTLVFPPVRFFAPVLDPAAQQPPRPPSPPAMAVDAAPGRPDTRPDSLDQPGPGGPATRGASLAASRPEPAPRAAGAEPLAGPDRAAQAAPKGPAFPGTGVTLPGAPAPAGPLLAPAAGAPLVTVAGETAPVTGALRGSLAPVPEPTVYMGTAGGPSLVPPSEPSRPRTP